MGIYQKEPPKSAVTEVRPRHGAAEPMGAEVAAKRLLPQAAGYASNVSKARILADFGGHCRAVVALLTCRRF
ncbi:MAG: hypothetical protein Q8O64_06740 [Sideroxyarcus sp.]|nr:hypothetical protein [Sideroxyarcus sp.]